MSRLIEIAFDDSAIISKLETLSPEALHHILDSVLNNGAHFPFNVFFCEDPSTSITGCSDQILIGLRFAFDAKSAVAA
jgi:hypothetical protein